MNLKFIDALYEESDTIEIQGNQADIQRYLKNGYTIVDKSFEMYTLSKPVTIIVWLDTSSGIIANEMKKIILDYYGKLFFSKAVFDQFVSDAKRGLITFHYDKEQGYYLK